MYKFGWAAYAIRYCRKERACYRREPRVGLRRSSRVCKGGRKPRACLQANAQCRHGGIGGIWLKAAFYPFDLSSPSAIPKLVDGIFGEWGRIDILVNNAGTQRRSPCVDFADEDWDFVHNINEKSVFVMCREV